MHHLLAFNQALGVNAVDTQLLGIQDAVFTQSQGSRFQTFQDLQVVSAYTSAVSQTRSQLVTPLLRLVGNHQIDPINVALLPTTDPNLQDLRVTPVMIRAGEEIEIQASNNLGAATEQTYGLLWVTDPGWEWNNVPKGLTVLRFTSTPVGVAQNWSGLANLTLPVQLPPGDYDVYGMTVQGAALVAARLRFPTQLWRPGCLARILVGDRSHWEFYGRFGYWGTFNNLALPQLEVLANAAGAVPVEGRIWIARR